MERIEDLLKVRDGEPADAALRTRVLADPQARAELERLERVTAELRALPLLEPPAELWERVLAASRGRRARRARRLRYRAAAAVLVLAAIVGGWLVASGLDRFAGPAPSVARDAPETPPGHDLIEGPLLAESLRLERALAALDDGPELMNAGTASMIAGLEDRIALIDDQLAFARTTQTAPSGTTELWRERVDLMNALLQVRYAHVQQVAFE